MSLQAIRCRPRAPPCFAVCRPAMRGPWRVTASGATQWSATSRQRDCARSVCSIVSPSFTPDTRARSTSMSAARSLSSDAVQPAFSKAGLPQQCVGRKSGENTMLRLFTVASVALAVATSAQAMSPAPLTQPDGMITQVRLGCGPGRTRVEGVCVARTTIRHTRLACSAEATAEAIERKYGTIGLLGLLGRTDGATPGRGHQSLGAAPSHNHPRAAGAAPYPGPDREALWGGPGEPLAAHVSRSRGLS